MAKNAIVMDQSALAASLASDALGVDSGLFSIQIIHVGTLNGNIHLQSSLDGVTYANCQDSTGTDIVIVALAGSALNKTYHFNGLRGRIRANFTRSSGTGALKMIAEG